MRPVRTVADRKWHNRAVPVQEDGGCVEEIDYDTHIKAHIYYILNDFATAASNTFF